MNLENLVYDALDPHLLGSFWETVVGGETLTDEPGIYETRLSVEGGPWLDLCFQQVSEPVSASPRLHVDLLGGTQQDEVVRRLLRLGATHLDVGQGDVPWGVLADPEGNPLCVLEERASHSGTGPVAALPLSSADPERDGDFWAWLTGWVDGDGSAPRSLRHPSGLGPWLDLTPESAPRSGVKNRLHLDVRLEDGEDADEVEAEIEARGGTRLRPGWGELPWRSYEDPSGNVFCVLPASSH